MHTNISFSYLHCYYCIKPIFKINTKSLSFYYTILIEMQPDVQKIRANRLKLKKSIKQICQIQSQDSGKFQWKKQTAIKQAGQIRRRRKTQTCFEAFQSMSTLKDLTINEGFDELFLKQQKIGEGAQSTVYKCVQKKTSSLYAVKIAKKKDPQLLQNMRQCYQVLKQLNHENIVVGKYLYLNQNKLTCHLVEQFVEYPSLRRYLNEKFQNCKQENKNCALDEQTAANILKTLLECLEYMQQMKVCHRDLKPDNILYCPKTGKIKIIDFQLAKMNRYQEQQVLLISQCGTLSYRAPETFKCGYGIEVDTWAIGIIAYEMLTGSLPFRSSCHQDLIKKITEQQLTFKCQLPGQTKRFLTELLNKNPKTRITPKDALSHIFMLKNVTLGKISANKIKKSNSYKYDSNDQSSESQDRTFTPSFSYTSQSKLRQFEGLDMGVRLVEQQFSFSDAFTMDSKFISD